MPEENLLQSHLNQEMKMKRTICFPFARTLPFWMAGRLQFFLEASRLVQRPTIEQSGCLTRPVSILLTGSGQNKSAMADFALPSLFQGLETPDTEKGAEVRTGKR